MRPRCMCGKIAGFWYGPLIYSEMTYQQYINNHAFCEEHADIDNGAEYLWIGFHKKDWRWLKKKDIIEKLPKHNERCRLPGWTATHVKEDGIRWYLGLYGGYHGWGNCKTVEDVIEATKDYKDVIIEERK